MRSKRELGLEPAALQHASALQGTASTPASFALADTHNKRHPDRSREERTGIVEGKRYFVDHSTLSAFPLSPLATAPRLFRHFLLERPGFAVASVYLLALGSFFVESAACLL